MRTLFTYVLAALAVTAAMLIVVALVLSLTGGWSQLAQPSIGLPIALVSFVAIIFGLVLIIGSVIWALASFLSHRFGWRSANEGYFVQALIVAVVAGIIVGMFQEAPTPIGMSEDEAMGYKLGYHFTRYIFFMVTALIWALIFRLCARRAPAESPAEAFA